MISFNRKQLVADTFKKYPEIIFNPICLAHTLKIGKSSSRRICQELNKEGVIRLILRGYYKYNNETKDLVLV